MHHADPFQVYQQPHDVGIMHECGRCELLTGPALLDRGERTHRPNVHRALKQHATFRGMSAKFMSVSWLMSIMCVTSDLTPQSSSPYLCQYLALYTHRSKLYTA